MSFLRVAFFVLLLIPHPGIGVVAQTSRTSTLTCRIRLDDRRNFNFSSLRVFVQYRIDGDGPWISTPAVSPDRNGNFSVSLPKSIKVSLAVDTADPTIRHAWAESDTDSYSLSSDLPWETIARSEVFIANDSPDSIERVIELRRGAAFYPNVPIGVTQGGLYFRKLPAPKSKHTNVDWFWPGSSIQKDVIGGLEPGVWAVSLYDEAKSSQKRIYERTITLSRGQILSLH